MRATANHLFREGRSLLWGIPANGARVQTLPDRVTDSDMAEAEASTERWPASRPMTGWL
jgi:hypothetical protein